MKTYLSIPIVALAAFVTLGPVLEARDCKRVYRKQTVQVVQQPAVIAERQDPWLVRAGRTIVRTPLIIGETLAGERDLVGPAPIAERVDRRYYIVEDDVDMFRSDGRTLSGRGPGEKLILFED